MHRYALRDDQWERIKDFLPGRKGHVGGTAADNRLFVDAVIFGIARASRGVTCVTAKGSRRTDDIDGGARAGCLPAFSRRWRPMPTTSS
jgi:transposase